MNCFTWDDEAGDFVRDDTPEPGPVTVEGWLAFEEGWSSFSNPYPLGTEESVEWLAAWYVAEAGMIAQRELDAGADPEDYK